MGSTVGADRKGFPPGWQDHGNLQLCPASFLNESVFSILLPSCPKEQCSSKIEYHSFSVLPPFVPFVPIKIHAESWVTGLQTHTGQFGFNLIPPGPPNRISDP